MFFLAKHQSGATLIELLCGLTIVLITLCGISISVLNTVKFDKNYEQQLRWLTDTFNVTEHTKWSIIIGGYPKSFANTFDAPLVSTPHSVVCNRNSIKDINGTAWYSCRTIRDINNTKRHSPRTWEFTTGVPYAP